MAAPKEIIDRAIADSDRLKRILKKSKQQQVRASDERGLAKATASAWFSSYRPSIHGVVRSETFETIDDLYRIILEGSDRGGGRSKYLKTLTSLKQALITLRTESLTVGSGGPSTSDLPPDFSPLIADVEMQRILISRWRECLLCVRADAAMAAIVMMGGLLEALLLARVNSETNKAAVFTARSAPKNPKTGGPKQLGEWMLNDFIQVLSELRWITVSAGAVGSVLRDYRNYIHPQKQLSHGLHLLPTDADLFWEVTKKIARQVVSSPP